MSPLMTLFLKKDINTFLNDNVSKLHICFEICLFINSTKGLVNSPKIFKFIIKDI